jgi:hypothetical protein
VPLKKDDYEFFKQFGWDKGISEQRSATTALQD